MQLPQYFEQNCETTLKAIINLSKQAKLHFRAITQWEITVV